MIPEKMSKCRRYRAEKLQGSGYTCAGAIAGDQRREGHVEVGEHAADAGDEHAAGEHVGRVLAQQLLGAGIGPDCQNRRALVLGTPVDAQLAYGVPCPAPK